MPLLEKKGKIFIDGIEGRLNRSLDFLKTQYPNYERFILAAEFIEYHHSDAVKSDFDQLERVGYFPSTEAEMELDHAIKHALTGSYKAAFADLRRALELTLTSVFLTSEHTEVKQANEWLNAKSDTPFVSTMLKQLTKAGRYRDINDAYDWSNSLRQFYWDISDFAHNKGQLKSYRHLNQFNLYSCGTSHPRIELTTLSIFCDSYIACVEEITVILCLYNPIIIVGLPMEEKFGLNPPMSGFYEEHQAEIVNQLIPDRYKVFFENLKNNDEEIKGLVDWVNATPDLTPEEIEKQIIQHKEFMANLNSSSASGEEEESSSRT